MERDPTASEEARRNRETLLRLALDASSLGVGTWDIAADRIELDERTHAILGTSPGEFPRTLSDYFSLVHPEDRAAFGALRSVARYQLGPIETRYRIVRPDGRICHVHFRGLIVCGEDGAPVRCVGVIGDVSEEQYHEEALRESEERFRRAIEEAPFPIMLHVEDGTVLLVNRVWTQLSGYPAHELRTIEQWTDRAYRHAASQVRAQIGALYRLESRVYEGTFTITTRSEEQRLWDFSSVPLGALADGRRLVMSAAVDVTERDLAKELARSNADLESFAYVASHDLQEPLRMVASFVQLLERRYRGRLDEDADRYIRFAVDGAKRMQRLIQDLLAYSRAGRESLSDERVDVAEIVGEAVENLRSRIEEARATVRVDELPEVRGSRSQLVAVFQNLIGNAIKFCDRPAPQIDVSAETDARGFVFRVHDNGLGIAREHAERIFRPFQRLHEAGQFPGNGIGLAIVARIVARHGGRVWVESEPGRGSTFFFTLPAADEKAEADGSPSEAAPGVHSGGRGVRFSG